MTCSQRKGQIDRMRSYSVCFSSLLYSSALYESETGPEVKERGINAVSILSHTLCCTFRLDLRRIIFDFLSLSALCSPPGPVNLRQWLLQFLTVWRCLMRRCESWKYRHWASMCDLFQRNIFYSFSISCLPHMADCSLDTVQGSALLRWCSKQS